MSGHIHHLSISHSPMFLLNSRLDLCSAPSLASRGPFSRSYGSNLPSSLTMNHSSALILYIRPPVSVCGTGDGDIKFSGFSRESDYALVGSPRRLSVLSGSAPKVDFPAPVNAYTLQPAIPSAGRTVTPPSPLHCHRQCRNINRLFHRPRRSA